MTDRPKLTPRALARLLDFAADANQTAEEARAELEADGVDVEAVVARLKRRLGELGLVAFKAKAEKCPGQPKKGRSCGHLLHVGTYCPEPGCKCTNYYGG